jgi:formate/nitrite transporter
LAKSNRSGLHFYKLHSATMTMISRSCAVLLAVSASSITAFAPSSVTSPRVARISIASQQEVLSSSSRLYLTKAEKKLDTFASLVNKNEQGAKQDVEEFSERLSLDISKTTYTSTIKSPPDTYITFAEKGASNAHLPKRKIFHQSVLGGCYVGFGGLISLMIAGNLGGVAVANPGIAKMAFAALFPVNLLLIVTSSAQLFTGNSATVAAAKFEGFVSWSDLWTSWSLSLAGNIVGCALFAKATMLGQIMNPGAAQLALATAAAKCSAPLVPTLIKAVMCNWMVSMAVFLSGAANDMAGKMVGCWFPISTFVGIGLEHSVANLFILPLALMLGANISLKTMIVKNLIPVIIGNAIAGSLIVAASYSYQFGRLGGLRRAIFQEKLANIQKNLAAQRAARDAQLLQDVQDKLADDPRAQPLVSHVTA